MRIAKRVLLFLTVNFIVVLTISLLTSLFGLRPYLASSGLDPTSLAIFCFLWGMGGAVISLFLSKTMAKWFMGVRIIAPETASSDLRDLVQMVHSLARQAGLPKMPEVGIYESPEVNAFATGPSRSSSLVAVSRGLLTKMNRAEIEGVLGHEITHIANGDMVTMTLLQGVINAFVMFLARALAFLLARAIQGKDEGIPYFTYMAATFVFEIVFMLFGALIVAKFSRWREFRADAGGARLAGRQKMIAALQALKKVSSIKDPRASQQQAFNALKISDGHRSLFRLWATHPSLELRIQHLEGIRKKI